MTATPDFTDGDLYKKLVEVLPTYVQDPFAAKPSLNVQRLRDAVGKSHEAVYKWLRSSRLTPANAKELVELANREENQKILRTLGRTPPTIQDFMPFVFA